jgi:glycosyltransferase involved in cell wall biosynthesis
VKIGFIFGDFCVGHRPLDYNDLFTSQRGLSGSDLGVSRVAQEFAKQGHDVSLFTVHCPNKPDVWEGVKLYDLKEKSLVIKSDWDAIISWSEPDQFRDLPSDPIRLCSQQLNGFTYCQPNFDDYVDVWASPSEAHLKFHAPQMPHPEKWVVVPDGCDPELYSPGKKIPGRVVHISSPDRGAHWLLSEWQNIKKQVPEAHLRMFYHSSHGYVCSFEKGFPTFKPGTNMSHDPKSINPSIYELGQRIRYFDHAMKKLGHLDVEHVGSVSRDQITQELNQAMVLGYPASVVSDFCEGFGCAVMEACAAGCIPVISDVDAFGDIYGGATPMIKSPVEPNMKEFTELVVRSLKDEKFIKDTTEKCQDLAAKYTWKLAADKYIEVLQQHIKYRGSK